MTDGSQPLIGQVMCEHYCLSVLMYTPGMTVMSLLLKNRYESKRSRDFFETENALAFALFLKKMCEHYCLSVLMHTPGMSVMSLLLNNRYESKRSRDFLL